MTALRSSSSISGNNVFDEEEENYQSKSGGTRPVREDSRRRWRVTSPRKTSSRRNRVCARESVCVQRDETSGRKLDTDDMRERRVGERERFREFVLADVVEQRMDKG